MTDKVQDTRCGSLPTVLALMEEDLIVYTYNKDDEVYRREGKFCLDEPGSVIGYVFGLPLDAPDMDLAQVRRRLEDCALRELSPRERAIRRGQKPHACPPPPRSDPEPAKPPKLTLVPGDYKDAKEVHVKLEAKAVMEDDSISRVYSHEITIPLSAVGFEDVTRVLATLYVDGCQSIIETYKRDGRNRQRERNRQEREAKSKKEK